MDAQENEVALPMRAHTIFGVCEAIGEDFGFNPFLCGSVRSERAVQPDYAIAAYFALGLVVLGSRLMFPPQSRGCGEPAPEASAC